MQDFLAINPEIFLTIVTMLILVVGAVSKANIATTLTRAAIGAFFFTFILVLQHWGEESTALSDAFISNNFTIFVKSILLLSSMVVLVLSFPYLRTYAKGKYEFPVLIMLSVIGMMIMVSARDLLVFYVGLEMQALALYILAAFDRDRTRSSEAGLKYFVLGALSSGVLLYGCSLIYGFTGSTHFESLSLVEYQAGNASIGFLFGLVMLIVGLCFKVSAVPFHMWTPDVYEGSPTIVTAFFSVVPKVAAIAIFLRILESAFGGAFDAWQQIIVLVSILTMTLGAFAALKQNNIKRLLAYSSIGHVGYILIGLATNTVNGAEAVLIYLAIYAVMSLGVFACLLQLRRRGELVEKLSDFSGLAKNAPGFAFVIAVLMFSMAGIPPLAGFFGKFFIFKAALESGLYVLATVGVLTSVVAAFYYIRVVKLMYFDDAEEEVDTEQHYGGIVVYIGAAVANLLFVFVPAPLFEISRQAAIALF